MLEFANLEERVAVLNRVIDILTVSIEKLPGCACELPFLAATHFSVNCLREFDARSRPQPLPDKFEYSHYLFGG